MLKVGTTDKQVKVNHACASLKQAVPMKINFP